MTVPLIKRYHLRMYNGNKTDFEIVSGTQDWQYHGRITEED